MQLNKGFRYIDILLTIHYNYTIRNLDVNSIIKGGLHVR